MLGFVGWFQEVARGEAAKQSENGTTMKQVINIITISAEGFGCLDAIRLRTSQSSVDAIAEPISVVRQLNELHTTKVAALETQISDLRQERDEAAATLDRTLTAFEKRAVEVETKDDRDEAVGALEKQLDELRVRKREAVSALEEMLVELRRAKDEAVGALENRVEELKRSGEEAAGTLKQR
eukprot:9489422-Pyramimonas_sp.AAC.1